MSDCNSGRSGGRERRCRSACDIGFPGRRGKSPTQVTRTRGAFAQVATTIRSTERRARSAIRSVLSIWVRQQLLGRLPNRVALGVGDLRSAGDSAQHRPGPSPDVDVCLRAWYGAAAAPAFRISSTPDRRHAARRSQGDHGVFAARISRRPASCSARPRSTTRHAANNSAVRPRPCGIVPGFEGRSPGRRRISVGFR